MKFLVLIMVFLLISVQGFNSSLSIKHVSYAETLSTSEQANLPNVRNQIPVFNDNIETSYIENLHDTQEERNQTSSSSSDEQEKYSLTEESNHSYEESLVDGDNQEQEYIKDNEEEIGEKIDEEGGKNFFNDSESVQIGIESEEKLRAVLLGETYISDDGIEYDFGEITNDTSLFLVLRNNLILTQAIENVQRVDVHFAAETNGVTISQSTAESIIHFVNTSSLVWSNIQMRDFFSPQGFIQTTGETQITFESVSAQMSTTTGRLVNNNLATVYLKGSNILTTSSGNVVIPTFIIANRLIIEDQLSVTHTSTNTTNTGIFEANYIQVCENTSVRHTRTANGNAGSVFHLSGSDAGIIFSENSHILVQQTGALVSLPNANQDSLLKTESGSMLDIQTGQGLSGGSSSTLGEIRLGAGSHLKFSEYGTVSNTSPTINVGYRFLIEDSTSDQPTILEGSRTGVATGAFIHVQTQNSEVQFGTHGKIKVDQTGPVLMASLSDVIVGEDTEIDATTGYGFTADTMIKNFRMNNRSRIDLKERPNNNFNVRRFYVRDSFIMETDTFLKSNRHASEGNAAFLQLQAANARFISGDNTELDILQRGAIFTGIANTCELHFGTNNNIKLISGQGMTGNTGAIRRIIVGRDSKIILDEHSAHDNHHFIRLRDELRIEDRAEIAIRRRSTRSAEAIRLTQANSQFSMGVASKLDVEVRGIAFYGTPTTDIYMNDRSEIDSKASWGFTGRRTIRSFLTGKNTKISHSEATNGNLTVATGMSDSPFRVSHNFTLGEESEFKVLRERNRNDAGAIRVNNTNGSVTLKKNSTMDIQQVGSAFYAPRGASFIMEDGASFYGKTSNGFNSNTRRFNQMIVGENSNFYLTDVGMSINRSTTRPMIDIANTIIVGGDAQFVVQTEINRNEVIYFRDARASLNLQGVRLFELSHPTMRSGNSRSTLQQLLRSGNNTVSNGLSINFDSQKVSLWTDTGNSPTEEFVNISGTLRINRNNGNNPSWGTFNTNSRSRYISVQNVEGSLESLNGADFTSAVSKNNYRRLVFSQAEGLVARIDALSDQSKEISGFMYKNPDKGVITYENTAGEVVQFSHDSPRIIWEDYRDEEERYCYFRIPLEENERLETDKEVSIFLSKPSVVTYQEITARRKVVKGIEYNAYNSTMDRLKINNLTGEEELHDLILQAGRVRAVDVITGEDMTDNFRVIDTDMTTDLQEDGLYYATLEVGNKAYYTTIGIDVTSKLDHMRVTIPTKMVFESLYDVTGINRNFESEEYEIINHSQIAVDTHINEMVIDDSGGIVLLEKDEDPLDYAENDSEEDDHEYAIDDISKPLLELNLKIQDDEIQLYENMQEQQLIHLSERSHIPVKLTGSFYGDYPRWVLDSEADQGGYYEESLIPNYRIILRFVPTRVSNKE